MANWFIWTPTNPAPAAEAELTLNPVVAKDKSLNQPDKNTDKDKDKNSNRSISSTMAPSNWMNWRRGGNSVYTESNEQAVKPDDEENDDDDDIDYNNDEVDDHVARDRKKGSTSSWAFWSNQSVENGSEEEDIDHPNDNKDKKKGIEEEIHTNKILNTTPKFQEESDQKDDAVLYKPHDNPEQFNEINTHKNENLRENVIVPDWNQCLPNQNSLMANNSITSTIFGNTSTSNQQNNANKVDFTNWRQFLNQVSTKLGFSSQTLTSVMNEEQPEETPENSSASKDRVEKEFNLLYERTYKLFGRSLAKLPPHKRACLPSYNKYYTNPGDIYVYDQQNQLEEDQNDPNTISITNDPMGNLLINHKPYKTKSLNPPVKQADIVNQKGAPLTKIKRILVIGVHGFFPTRMIRPLIGAPKGTSSKFANEAEKAVIRYCIENGLIKKDNSNDISIQKIALEKEGKIFDRVSFFTEILIKWQQELNEADFIFIAAHSQGCVVSIILFAQLIKMGILKAPLTKRIGILGMAGINNGPFYGVDKSFFMKAYSAIEHDSLMELFELSKFTSEQSLVYKESMQIIINSNVKLCFIGSINDQLVPLYSALASHIFHPNIYRACYIDHSSQTPMFIKKLVSLCCQLQNMGYFDNNVLKELSTALAGPLTGGGHSKIYNDGKVYDLGVKFILDTDDIIIPPTGVSEFIPVDYSGISIGAIGPSTIHTGNTGTNTHTGTDTNTGTNDTTNRNPKETTDVISGIGPYGSINTNAEEIVKLPLTNQVYIKEFNIGKIGTNPFILPWCLRGLLFNIEKNWPNNNKLLSVEKGGDVGRTGYDEINDLYETFDSWKPETKVLKELKFRLNGLRASKL